MAVTVTGTVERLTFENEETGFRVVRLGSLEGSKIADPILTVVGIFQPLGTGIRVRVTGELVEDKKWGRQLRAQAVVPVDPDTLEALEKYLASGLVEGVGPGFAKRIVESFGMDTLRILDAEPERLREVSGLGPRRAAQIKKTWGQKRAQANVMMLLQSHGASPALAHRIVKQYGERSAAMVQRYPYRLAMDVRGVGFKTADKMARSLGIAGNHPERAQAGTLHVLGLYADAGNVLAPRDELTARTAEMLEVDEEHVQAAIDALWAKERVVVEEDVVYLARLHRAEVVIAGEIQRLLGDRSQRIGHAEETMRRFEARQHIELAPVQREAVTLAASEKVLIVTGGPGVGKTTLVRAIIEVFDRATLATRLVAPTGRAAKRLSETTGRAASTIHRLLEYEPRTASFARNRDRKLEVKALVVDEASMVDLPLAAALLEAVPDDGRVVIVGDADQLPSVGPGAFLRDLIGSGVVHTVHLNQIFRQSSESRIVHNAHRILRGEAPESADPEQDNADFFVIPRTEPEAAAATIVELVTSRIPRRFSFDPVREIQVLAPMHRGVAGTQALNMALQESLNPDPLRIELKGREFRRGDKVLQTRNDYDNDIFNGDIGRIVEVNTAERTLKVDFDGHIVELRGEQLDSLVLAYATSVHKSQGSEYPALVLPLLTSHFIMLNRHLLYTAVTRARRLCVLVADPRALKLALAEGRREPRLSKLAERLRAG